MINKSTKLADFLYVFEMYNPRPPGKKQEKYLRHAAQVFFQSAV